jgi:hypothetical protein
MKYDAREQVLAAFREIEAMKEARNADNEVSGEYFAHIDLQVVITYMGRVPVEFSAECYVATNDPTKLIPATKETYESITDAEDVFRVMNNAVKGMEDIQEGEENDAGDFDEDDLYEKG